MMKNTEKEVFIWTEAFNCGEILIPMLSSYLKHNNYPIHVFGTKNDFKEISVSSELIRLEALDKESKFTKSIENKILKGYKKGHKGTAILWDYIINSRREEIFIHLDSDIIILDDCISDLIKAIEDEGYAIAGSRRPYMKRTYRLEGKDGEKLNSRPDCVNTDCFAFTTKYIKKRPRFWLRRKILGRRVSIKPSIDAFDPITFEIIQKGGKIKYMDSPESGFHYYTNLDSKFMKAIISFGAVGSGCNFYKNGHSGIPTGYSSYALSSYSLFAATFLNKEIDIPPLKNEILSIQIARIDKENWILKE